ncbi:MAG: hypothetical protein IIX77_00080 [Oscillospiraceae bacterium]|nr:hypothetical protein [Oscillospiraceae bacterium]
MSMTNLASRYAKQVDERFHRESQALLALNNDFKFTGVKTVNVYSIPTVAMTDYTRRGTARYGEATDLARSVQRRGENAVSKTGPRMAAGDLAGVWQEVQCCPH